MKNKINIVYILGCGRSGSTLLDMILGLHPEISSSGEVQYLDINKTKNYSPLFKKIAFEFKKKLSQNNRDLKNFELIKNLRYISLRELYKINNLEIPNNFSGIEDENNFLTDNYILFETIRDLSEKKIIIDSSKTISRLYNLNKSDKLKIKIIYLHRNGLSFVNSGKKKGLSSIRSSLHWLIRNYRSQKLLKECKLDFFEISYDNLTLNTKETIVQLCDFLGVDYFNHMLDFRKNTNLIGGNPVMKDKKNNRIVNNSEYLKSLNYMDKLIFKLIGSKMNRKLGYK